MSKVGTPLLGLLGLIGIAAASVFQFLLLPEASYRATAAGQIGYGAVILGIALTAGIAMYAAHRDGGEGSVQKLSGPVVPLFYTGAAAVLWLASPLLGGGLAKGLHGLLLCAALFGMVAWTFASAVIEHEDQSQKSGIEGQASMLLAAKDAERRLSQSESAALKDALSQLMDDISYADRNGSAGTSAIEASVVSGLEALTADSEVSAVQELRDQVAKRADVLKAGR